jgi:hypothetical protein
MKDIAISKSLAIAIGWTMNQIDIDGGRVVVAFPHPVTGTEFPWFRRFDYRDPDVIWPIAAKFNCFPCRFAGARWGAWVGEYGQEFFADTPEKAVALAVSNRRVRHESHHPTRRKSS